MNLQRYRLLFADATRRETTIFAGITNNNRITNQSRDEHCRTNKEGIKKHTPGTL